MSLPDTEGAAERLREARTYGVEIDSDYVLSVTAPRRARTRQSSSPLRGADYRQFLEGAAGEGWSAGLAEETGIRQTWRLIWTPPEQSAAQTAYLGAQLRANDRGALIRLRAAMLIGGDVSAAARLLGVPLRSLQRWRQPGGLWAVRALLTALVLSLSACSASPDDIGTSAVDDSTGDTCLVTVCEVEPGQATVCYELEAPRALATEGARLPVDSEWLRARGAHPGELVEVTVTRQLGCWSYKL